MRKIDIFQNLLLITLADNRLADEERAMIHKFREEMDIPAKEYSNLMLRADNLDYIIPSTYEAQIDSLRKLILLCMADGYIHTEEKKALQNFAERCQISQDILEKLIVDLIETHTEQVQQQVYTNQQQYQKIFSTLKKAPFSDKQIAIKIRSCIQNHDLNYFFSEEAAINEAFYKFLWIVYCRYALLIEGGTALFVMQMQMVETGVYTLEDVFYDLQLSEDAYFDGRLLKIYHMPLDQVKQQLKNTTIFS